METTIKKNQEANVGKYSYKYVDIAQIHDYLEEINARYIQQIKRIDNDDYIMTKRCFDNKWEDEWLQGAKVVDATLVGVKNPAQEQGSALTYARRYSLLMAFGLATEDDDAQSLSKSKEPTIEDAKQYTFTFGKHKGTLLTDILDDVNEDDYVDWLVNNSKDEYLLKCIELLTGQTKPNESELKDRVQLLVQYKKLVVETKSNEDKLKQHYGVEKIDDMSDEQLVDAINIMKGKLK